MKMFFQLRNLPCLSWMAVIHSACGFVEFSSWNYDDREDDYDDYDDHNGDDDDDDDDCEEGFPAFAATESTRCLSLRNTALNSSTTLNTQHLTLNTKHWTLNTRFLKGLFTKKISIVQISYFG